MYGEMAWRLLFVLMFIVICPCALEVIAPIIAKMIVTLRILIIVSPHGSQLRMVIQISAASVSDQGSRLWSPHLPPERPVRKRHCPGAGKESHPRPMTMATPAIKVMTL
jgi:hypothetical protein